MPNPDPAPGGPTGFEVTTTAGQGGRVIVASDALLSQLHSLARLAESLRLCAGALVSVIDVLEPQGSIASPVPPAALEARRLTRAACAQLLTAQSRAEQIVVAVKGCLTEYAETERFAQSLEHRLGESVAWSFGVGARIFGLPVLLSLGSAALIGTALVGKSPRAIPGALQGFLEQHGGILTSIASVAIIRQMADNANGFGAGFLGLPPSVAATLDSSGLTGVSSSSDEVVALGRGMGLFQPTGETVTKTSSFEFGAPPTSLVARAESFPRPDTDPGGEQIRIDRYVEAGAPDRFDVYIAGTVTFDPKTGAEPFDFTSDLNGVGGQSSASYQAVVDAMRQAGVTPDSPVVLNGYSQGGLVASQVAASGQFAVHGVVTFGAPSGQVAIPASIPVLTVRNAEDLVPATSGYDINPNAVVVERPVFAGSPIPSDHAVPAHELSEYQQTAAMVDQAHSPEVRAVLDPLNQFGAGADRVDSTLWRATRVPPH